MERRERRETSKAKGLLTVTILKNGRDEKD
jgi:hypothetical protein